MDCSSTQLQPDGALCLCISCGSRLPQGKTGNSFCFSAPPPPCVPPLYAVLQGRWEEVCACIYVCERGGRVWLIQVSGVRGGGANICSSIKHQDSCRFSKQSPTCWLLFALGNISGMCVCVCGDEELPSAGRRQGVVPGGWWLGGGLGPDFVWFTCYKLIMEIEEVKAEEAAWLKIQLFYFSSAISFSIP